MLGCERYTEQRKRGQKALSPIVASPYKLGDPTAAPTRAGYTIFALSFVLYFQSDSESHSSHTQTHRKRDHYVNLV